MIINSECDITPHQPSGYFHPPGHQGHKLYLPPLFPKLKLQKNLIFSINKKQVYPA